MKLALFIAALPLALAASAAHAAPPAWQVDKGRSSIDFSGTQSGTAFKGRFGQWDAAIQFDPADLAHSSARVTIGMASAKTGDATQDATIPQGEWFDTARFPRATFTATKFSAAGKDRYVGQGTLTIKGKALPVSLPFSLTIQGGVATMKGQLKVDRIAYDIGAKTDATGAFVSRQIAIDIAVTARRAK
jgi:cytochrome b561